MFGDETAEKSRIKFDGFTVDFLKDGKIRLGENEFKLGYFGCNICNIPKDPIYILYRRGIFFASYNKELNNQITTNTFLFNDIKQLISVVARNIIKFDPFCFFDFSDSILISEDVFSDYIYTNVRKMKEYTEKTGQIEDYNLMEKVNRKILLGKSLVEKYSFFCKGVACFTILIKKFIDYIIEEDCRTKEELALCTTKFINTKEAENIIRQADFDVEYADNTFHSRVTSIPIIVNDSKSNKPYIARRMYFNNIVDFLFVEWLEAMANGHYIWKCKVCGNYFLMTSPCNQVCCDEVNKEYNTKCEDVTTAQIVARRNKIYRHERKNNPLWHTRNLRCNSIRKNKNLGKYSEAVSDEARKVLDELYYLAEKDAEYALDYYYQDVILENIYEAAIKRLKRIK